MAAKKDDIMNGDIVAENSEVAVDTAAENTEAAEKKTA